VKLQEQIPRNALVWIVLSLFALVAPHVARLPVWVLVVYLVAVVWRILVHTGRWSFPGRWVKLAIALSCFLGIYLSYGSFVALEPTVALLLTAFALKLVELIRRKDAYVLLFLGYFVCITEFLFSQDLLITLYSLVCVLLVTTALVALHQPGEQRFNWRSMRVSGVMLLQAMPLMVVLFFIFPRIGPLWTVPIKSNVGTTGMSDYMRPGDIASLSQSAEVAFRVKFEGAIPPKSELYWRGLVFSRLDDDTWRTLDYFDMPPGELRPAQVDKSGDALRYSVIIEPSRQNWLYALRYAESSHSGVIETADYRLYSPVALESEFMYPVRSWPATLLETELGDWRRNIETRLPGGSNPRTRELASAMRAQAADDSAFAQAVLNKFSTEEYVYTLKPGTLPAENGMDHFLFESRRGFCEHYAYAFTFMMRAAGVPARVVAGYQGGEINPVNRTVIVHQFDAHAWTEIWLAGEGWKRIDPTAAVSPLRIELGLEDAMQTEGSFLESSPLSPLRYRGVPLVNLMRLRYDALTYRWQSWVTGFDNERQLSLLQDLFGEISTRMFITVLLGSWALVLVPVAFTLLWRRRAHGLDPLQAHYRLFCERLSAAGVERAPSEPPGEFARRAMRELPAYAGPTQHITQAYERLAYGSAEVRDEELKAFVKSVRAFRPARAAGPLPRRPGSDRLAH
tara:strand:+ start:22994 stop:25036 length:2043 start_codon:yes stop_codon:yes gene_type:complete